MPGGTVAGCEVDFIFREFTEYITGRSAQIAYYIEEYFAQNLNVVDFKDQGQ